MRVLTRVALFLGIVGALLCVVGAVGVWYVESRIDRAREQLFERVDQSLSDIDGRVVAVQKLAAQSKVTIEEIQQRAEEFTRKGVRDRLAERFNIDSRVQRLTSGLKQADLMLELSHETVRQVRQVLEMGAELGFPLQADSIDPLLERIADVKRELSRAVDAAESLGKQTGEDGESESLGGRMEQITILAARLLATFGTVDSRLSSFRGRLTDAQDAIGKLNAKTHARLVALAVGATLFLVWMGAGQVCLWRWARSS